MKERIKKLYNKILNEVIDFIIALKTEAKELYDGLMYYIEDKEEDLCEGCTCPHCPAKEKKFDLKTECPTDCFDLNLSPEVEEDNKVKWLKSLDWNNLTDNDIDSMLTFDIRNYNEIVNWYKISKYNGLPEEFCIMYRDSIIWEEYNKRRLTKKVKDLLKEEGRI